MCDYTILPVTILLILIHLLGSVHVCIWAIEQLLAPFTELYCDLKVVNFIVEGEADVYEEKILLQPLPHKHHFIFQESEVGRDMLFQACPLDTMD